MNEPDPAPSKHEIAELKYARGTGPRGSGRRRLAPLEGVTLAHVAIFLVGTTWAFGGQADWLIKPLASWGSLGALITLAAVLQDAENWRRGWMRPLLWLIPVAAFNALVIVASFNPNLREITFEGEILLAKTGGQPGWPSSARPALALRALWLFDAIYLSCFNLALVIRQRRALRLLLLIAVTNAALLAVFGTVQKLSGARGLFFDAVRSPQPQFFSSFVYHNHWGAFMLLMMATCLGLVWHYGRRRTARDFFHTPASAGIVVLLLLAATVPLSTSRSSTILALLLLSVAFLHGVGRLVAQRRRYNESAALPVAGALVGLLLAGGAVWFIARDSITVRLAKTREQVAEIQQRGSLGQRTELYRNTWRMAQDKLWFGWGMASYPHVFTLYNTEKTRDRLPIFYHDAHSDWLQAVAEHGLVGSSLLTLCGLMPLLRLRRRHLASPLPMYLLFGCALLLLYAWVEFPFGNVAVVLSWWLCLFTAVQYARLQDREESSGQTSQA